MHAVMGEPAAVRPAEVRGGSVRLPAGSRSSRQGLAVIEVVGAWRGLPPRVLLAHGRGTRRLALARQEAMYLMHVALSCSYTEVAEQFGRDRTTVAHACWQVEDLRDEPGYDAELDRIEALIQAAAREPAHAD